MNQVVAYTPAAPNLTPQNLSVAMELANMMSGAKLVPQHLQGKPADCLLVIEQAVRWGMSPFAVAQATSVISGKLMYEGKLVAAAINSSGILSDRLSYEFTGTGQNRTVTVHGTIRGESAPREAKVCVKDVKTQNSMWTKQEDQQLVYSGARVWARRHVPEVMLGVYTPEEFDEPRNGGANGSIGALAVPSPPSVPSAPLTEAQWAKKIEAAIDKDELLRIGAEIEGAMPEETIDRLLPAFKAKLKAIKAGKPAQEPIHVPLSGRARKPAAEPTHDPETGEIADDGMPEHMQGRHGEDLHGIGQGEATEETDIEDAHQEPSSAAGEASGTLPLGSDEMTPDESASWRSSMIKLFDDIQTEKARTTILRTQVEPKQGKAFPGDMSDVQRAAEKARVRLAKPKEGESG